MKKLFVFALIISVIAFTGCSSLSGIVSAGQGVQAAAQIAEPQDFKSGEVLCSSGTEIDVESMSYYVAKVVTPATPASKNQAEALYVSDGTKAWCSYVIPSHKAKKAELTIDKMVFVLYHSQDTDAKNVSVTDYRKNKWVLMRITSTDELFKNRIEVGGTKYHPDLIRIPDIPIE